MARHLLFLPLLLVALSAHAQTPLARPDLDLRVNGAINALARAPDGGMVVGGSFVSVDGVARTNLARLRSDGTLDPDWNPSADASVYTLAMDSNANIYVGGQFTHIGGIARGYLAKLSDTGVVDPSWNPAPAGLVSILALDGAGSIYVGGSFTSVGADGSSATPHSHLARFTTDATGALDVAWNPAPNGSVRALALDAAAIYVGGQFSSIGGVTRNGLARLAVSSAGSADATWYPAISNSPSLPVVFALMLDGAGSIYVGGGFNMVNGTARSGLAKISLADSGTLQAFWNPTPGSYIDYVLLDGGYVYLGGAGVTINGVALPTLMRATAAGAADPAWNPSANGPVAALIADGSGGVYAGGGFSSIAGQQHYALAHVDGTGAASATPDVEARATVNAMIKQHDGGMIVAGNFLRADGLTRTHVLRLLPDDTIDPDWQVAFNAPPLRLAVDSADDVFAVGQFTLVGGSFRQGLAKLRGHGSGGVDPTWNPDLAGNMPQAVVVAGDDAVYLGGFSFLGKYSDTGNGARDTTWNPIPDNQITALAVGGPSLYVAGFFSTIAGQPIAHLAKFDVSHAWIPHGTPARPFR